MVILRSCGPRSKKISDIARLRKRFLVDPRGRSVAFQRPLGISVVRQSAYLRRPGRTQNDVESTYVSGVLALCPCRKARLSMAITGT